MGIFDDWKKRGRKAGDSSGSGGFEYYEDTHNERGEYVGGQMFNDVREPLSQPSQALNSEKPVKLPDSSQHVVPRNYQNVVVYRPATPEDVQTLIDFLKRREPAIVNLDDMEAASSQRVLDFVSGAIYALNGSVHRIAGNIFLLSPEGVEITVPLANP